ncbi:MAG: hypothetical protein ACR2J4_01600 [Deinococcus sp.]
MILKVIRQHFAEWFTVTVSALMAATTEAEKKTLLGAAVDYRTRVVQGRLRREMKLVLEEEFIRTFRHAVMQILRDEAYAQGTPGERFTTPHVVKGREDEQQVLVLAAMEEIDQVTSSFSPVYRDSKLLEAAESRYANDSREIVGGETEAEVDRLLCLAGIQLGNGETPAEQLQNLRRKHDVLTDHAVWKHVLRTPTDHLDRLRLALSLDAQLSAATDDRVTAHRYVMGGDDVVVPRIARHSLPPEEVAETRSRTYCYVVAEGWTFTHSGYVPAVSFGDARAAVTARFTFSRAEHVGGAPQGTEVFLA